MENKEGGRTQDAIHLSQHCFGLIQVLNYHIGGNNFEGTVGERQCSEITQDWIVQTAMGPDAWDIDIHTDEETGSRNDLAFRSGHPLGKHRCPQPESSHRLPGRIAALTAS